MKQHLSIILAALLTVTALTGCTGQNSSPEQNVEPAANQGTAQTNGTSNPIVSSNASAAYAKLIAYKTENYLQQSVADFNAALASTPDELTDLLAAQADATVSPDDENYDFITTTIRLSAHELYCEYMGEESIFYAAISKNSRPCKELDADGEITYEFRCSADLQVFYSIVSPELLTIAERDNTLLTFKEEMQNYLNGLSEDEIKDGNIKMALTSKAAEITNSLSSENMKVSCEIPLIEISDAGTETIQ